MRLEDIQNETEKDSVIDEFSLDTESLKIPVLYQKYLNYFNYEFRVLKGIEQELFKVKKERHQYYLGQCSEEVYKADPMPIKVLRSDLDLYMDSDPKYSEAKSKFEIQKLKVDTIEKFMDTLKQRHNHIKNALEWKKFSSGG